MKILIFSDLHLHNHVYGASLVDGVNSRLLDGAHVLEQIATYINDNPVDEVVFCGDLFHTHGKIDAGVLKVAYEGWEKIVKHHDKPAHIYALVGNHDTADKTMKTHAMHWMEALGINVVDTPWHNGFNGLPRKLSFLPYTEDVEVITQFFEDAIKKNDTSYLGQTGGTVCFMHLGIDGVPMKSGFVPGSAFNTDMIPEGVQHVFSGHYHPHMKVTDKATVVGTPLQLNWADEGDRRGFLVYDTEKDEQWFHELEGPKFITIDWNKLIVPPDVLVDNNFVRVTNYVGHHPDDIRDFLAGAGARSVEFVVKKEEVDRLQPLGSDELHIPTIIEEYEKQREVSPERSKIGKELMK
jgi:DNA repair exonuclease SbcCD nuclease subunit